MNIPFLVAQIIVPNPCIGIEPYTWEWWMKGCWMLPDIGLTLAAAGAVGVGALVWRLLRQRGV